MYGRFCTIGKRSHKGRNTYIWTAYINANESSCRKMTKIRRSKCNTHNKRNIVRKTYRKPYEQGANMIVPPQLCDLWHYNENSFSPIIFHSQPQTICQSTEYCSQYFTRTPTKKSILNKLHVHCTRFVIVKTLKLFMDKSKHNIVFYKNNIQCIEIKNKVHT